MRGHRAATETVPREVLLAGENVIELQNRSGFALQSAFVPAAMEPYDAPLIEVGA